MLRKILLSCFTKSYCTMKILLLISFAFTAISSTPSSNSSEAHDITTLLNNAIAKTFQNMNSVTINKVVRSMENLNSFTFETNADCELGPFENEFYFTGITVTPVKVEPANLRQVFYRNRMTQALFFTYLSIEMKGHLGATPDTAHVGFARSLNFENISIHIVAEPLNGFSNNEFYPYTEIIHYQGYESHYIYSPWFHEDLTPDVQYELERQIKDFLPSLFEFNLRNNENFVQTFHATFCHHPEEEITTRYPSLDIFRTKNYYFIPNITSLDRTLSNITITGMHNFDCHSFVENSGLTASTLTIKNIRGTTDLHYAGRNFTIFPLHFEVDCISITVDRKQQSVSVNAHNYRVIETKMNVSLTEYQSQWVMEGIQLAIASSIMPSMKYYRNRNNSTNSLKEHPIVKISTKLSQQFEGSTIQKLYDTWNITIPESFNAQSSIQIEPYNYNISIDAKPRTKLEPYPELFTCNLYNNLRFDFEIPSWFGKISVLNTTHEFDDIDFLMGNVLVVLVKENNSNDFELKSLAGLDVELLSNPYNFTDHERLEIKQKTQQLMISLIEKTVSFFAEPLLSLPLDYCTAPVKIFDDFLPFYADYELPFRVPISRIANESLVSNISNAIITEWTKSPSAYVAINQDLVNGSISTYVNLELARAKIRMIVESSLRQFDELDLTLSTLQVQNYTDSGKIAVDLNLNSWDYDSQNNKMASLSTSKIDWIEMKLRDILGECFNNLTSLVV